MKEPMDINQATFRAALIMTTITVVVCIAVAVFVGW